MKSTNHTAMASRPSLPLTPFIEELLDIVASTCGPLRPGAADALHRTLWERFYTGVGPEQPVRSADHNALNTRLLCVEIRLSATRTPGPDGREHPNY